MVVHVYPLLTWKWALYRYFVQNGFQQNVVDRQTTFWAYHVFYFSSLTLCWLWKGLWDTFFSINCSFIRLWKKYKQHLKKQIHSVVIKVYFDCVETVMNFFFAFLHHISNINYILKEWRVYYSRSNLIAENCWIMLSDNGSTDWSIPRNVVLLFVNMIRHHAVGKDSQERENNILLYTLKVTNEKLNNALIIYRLFESKGNNISIRLRKLEWVILKQASLV